MNQDIFSDGISSIHITGNIIRLDLMSFQPQLKSENGQPVFNVTQRIVMPLEAFIQSFAVQERVMQQLIEAGVLKKSAAPEDKTVQTFGKPDLT